MAHDRDRILTLNCRSNGMWRCWSSFSLAFGRISTNDNKPLILLGTFSLSIAKDSQAGAAANASDFSKSVHSLAKSLNYALRIFH